MLWFIADMSLLVTLDITFTVVLHPTLYSRHRQTQTLRSRAQKAIQTHFSLQITLQIPFLPVPTAPMQTRSINMLNHKLMSWDLQQVPLRGHCLQSQSEEREVETKRNLKRRKKTARGTIGSKIRVQIIRGTR